MYLKHFLSSLILVMVTSRTLSGSHHSHPSLFLTCVGTCEEEKISGGVYCKLSSLIYTHLSFR